MAYARKRTTKSRSNSRSSGRGRGGSGNRRAATPRRKSGVRRGGTGRSSGTVRIVIEHAMGNEVQRPSVLQSMGDVKAPKRAKF